MEQQPNNQGQRQDLVPVNAKIYGSKIRSKREVSLSLRQHLNIFNVDISVPAN